MPFVERHRENEAFMDGLIINFSVDRLIQILTAALLMLPPNSRHV